MPCKGSRANCITLLRMVMAPTARSPPYFNRDELKQTEITLSLACMVKVARPNAMQGKISFAPGKKFSFFSRRMVFFPVRKRSTHTQETPCDRTVATAAPRMPIPSPKISTGSSTIFSTAPMSTVCIPTVAKPCAVIKAFIPSVSWTNRVPRA